LIIEVTSAHNRVNDVEIKVREYHRAPVAWYIIVDAHEDTDTRTLDLIGYRHTPQGYERFLPNERGWLWLEPANLWLGTEEGQVACYDPQGNKIGDYTAISKARRVAEEKVVEEQMKVAREAEARRAAEERAAEEQVRLAREVEARQAAEARIRELEAELKRLRTPEGPDN
jgi:hypothetical protein